MFTAAPSARDLPVAESDMIAPGRPRTEPVLSHEERVRPTAVAARRKNARALVRRERIVHHRLGGWDDAARSGAPRTLTDAHVKRVSTRTLERKPKQATHWSTRAMAQRCGLTPDAVHRIWKAFGLQSHRERTRQLSTDPSTSTQGQV